MTDSLLTDRLREWSQDELHLTQSVRMHKPTYANPAELRADVRALLAENEQLREAVEWQSSKAEARSHDG